MRLTLRTMLACLDADDRLDPADVEDLSQKIQQSAYATELSARIRRLVQHPRVGTPRLDAKGNGLDANSVAEYLDNTLAHERISDFERSCIESDVRLAEVGACHQILVLVLEQPAEIGPTVRERMYRLGAESSRVVPEESSERALPGGGAVRIDRPAAAATVALTPKPLPEVPDYLRAGRKPSLWPLALAAVLAFVAVGVGLRLMGPLDKTHPMARLMGAGAPAPVTPTDALPSDQGDVPTPMPDPVVSEDKKIDAGAYESPPLDPVSPVDPLPGEEPPMPAETDTPPTDMPPSETVPPVEPAVANTLPTESTLPGESTTPPLETPRTVPVPTQDPVEPPQPPAAGIGRLVSEDQVLMRIHDEAESTRVAARGPIYATDYLVAMPAYRPQLLLGSNIQLTMTGETRLVPGMVSADGVASPQVIQGRVLAVSVGKENAQLALTLGHVKGVITFNDVDSEVAVEVRNWLPPGANPETEGSTVPVVRIYTTRGAVTWREGAPGEGGDEFKIAAGQVRNYVGDVAETVAVAALPDWIDGKNIADIDRRAAREVETKLAGDQGIELALREMASTAERRAEVRSLAIRSLLCLGHYEPFLAAIADDTQRAYWSIEFELCRDALALSPLTAGIIHDTFVKLRGQQDGENLYRMLWGFSPEDLKSGLAEELVKSLDVELLDYRVLAFENLRRITGSTQLYQPHLPAARRRTPVAQWRERLKDGEIAYKVPPAPIMDPKPTSGSLRNTESPLEP